MTIILTITAVNTCWSPGLRMPPPWRPAAADKSARRAPPVGCRAPRPAISDSSRPPMIKVAQENRVVPPMHAVSGCDWSLKYLSTFALLPGRLSPRSQQEQTGQNSPRSALIAIVTGGFLTEWRADNVKNPPVVMVICGGGEIGATDEGAAGLL